MNKVSYAINGVLTVAIVILFILFFTKRENVTGSELKMLDVSDTSDVGVLPVAYVDVDSLLTHYRFAVVSADKLMSKFKTSNNTITQKQKQLEREAGEFQRKLETNAFLKPERAEQESQRLQKMNVELQQMAQRMEGELARDEQKIHEEIADSVKVCIDVYNQTANYHLIFSNKGMDNLLLAKDQYNITQDIIDLMNARYKDQK